MIGLYHHLIQTLIKCSHVSATIKNENKGKIEMETEDQEESELNIEKDIYKLDPKQQ